MSMPLPFPPNVTLWTAVTPVGNWVADSSRPLAYKYDWNLNGPGVALRGYVGGPPTGTQPSNGDLIFTLPSSDLAPPQDMQFPAGGAFGIYVANVIVETDGSVYGFFAQPSDPGVSLDGIQYYPF